ncbi:sporulation integral membrane protein YtvI [Erysipelothrix urinaevulpis]|uniref:sporulation integral membrane protein YtvI n=1 Tax=Erysipelothrix urinaevulpis TaxID=2683717 RepID=UPI001356DD6A|nr:sporulation integral membrane protein YtvI [Erysipelothrix urinaevulpis]
MERLDKRKDFIINVMYWAIVLSIVFVVLRFTTQYLMPFVIGFFISFLLRPFILRLTKRLGERKWVSLLVIVLFYTLLAFLMFWVFIGLFSAIQNFAMTLPSFYQGTIYPALEEVNKYLGNFMENLSPDVLKIINEMTVSLISSLESIVKSISSGAVNLLTRVVSSVPSILISILISIISSFFFTMDYQNVVQTSLGRIPKKQRDLILDIKDGLVSVIGKYLKAYALLMSLTFIELSIGFLILRVANPIGLAAVIAAVDILPVLGTGGVVIPWMIIEALTGNVSLAIGLLVLYLVITVIRNILEPKVIGDQIGLHPLITLMSIFVGVKLFGFWGLFGLPIAITIIKTLHDEGKIDIFKRNDNEVVVEEITE